MKRYIGAIGALSLLVLAVAGAQEESGEKQKTGVANFKTVTERGSYAFGYNVGSDMAARGIEVDPKTFARGLIDALTKKESLLTEEEIQTALGDFQEELQQKMIARQKVQAKKGVEFLETNKKKKGIKTTKSGLQYEVLKAGNGESPKATDTVTTHYHGTLIDGTVFDSSVDRNEPASFPVNRVIDGWTEALQLMKVGSKWKLYVPSDLAYGQDGRPPTIGPNSVLIFEVELLGIE